MTSPVAVAFDELYLIGVPTFDGRIITRPLPMRHPLPIFDDGRCVGQIDYVTMTHHHGRRAWVAATGTFSPRQMPDGDRWPALDVTECTFTYVPPTRRRRLLGWVRRRPDHGTVRMNDATIVGVTLVERSAWPDMPPMRYVDPIENERPTS